MSDNNNTTPLPASASKPEDGNATDATDVLFPDATPIPPITPTAPIGASTPGTPTVPNTPTVQYPASASEPERLRARFGTIFWGVILLVFAAFMVTSALVPIVLDPSTWIIAGLVAGGVVLVIAGIAAAVRRTD
ncbi:hypothetical protein [Mycetocola zhadangensis]|uniref:Uncharacterized protein n=1 Tax=Mycetocola zhadangensis TaxID=1164595 RepID=A0A3L7J1M8_9MICO|nr:hypothetical protein [Mycetocola zhadangensis]RLQ84380.1 hypothetical protein D9V28_09290 [Mycetocola zhadangensis]GGE93458.1 hypothetical protein GCM10011313_15660 [Mycetocola zhadangensis]